MLNYDKNQHTKKMLNIMCAKLHMAVANNTIALACYLESYIL